MASIYCPDCEEDTASLGHPSHARWVGPDGVAYCSMHFIGRFGHAEKLVPIQGYVAPEAAKPAAKKKPRARRRTRTSK